MSFCQLNVNRVHIIDRKPRLHLALRYKIFVLKGNVIYKNVHIQSHHSSVVGLLELQLRLC